MYMWHVGLILMWPDEFDKIIVFVAWWDVAVTYTEKQAEQLAER